MVIMYDRSLLKPNELCFTKALNFLSSFQISIFNSFFEICMRLTKIGLLRNTVTCYTMLPYLTIRHAQTVGVNDLSCLEHAKQSTSLTEIVAHKNLPVSTWFQA